MPKSIKNIFDSKLQYINFYQAHIRASNHKRNRRNIISFEIDLETNLMNLVRSIQNGTYHIGVYHTFIIYEPKERVIQSLPYIDRVVHQWYVEEFIIPFIVPKFIKDTYACIQGRGTHKAVATVQKYMRLMKRKCSHYYVLKCDVKKYFYSINKTILFQIMKRYIKDKKLLAFTEKLIFDGGSEVGIPIGNYTSQYFANIYLNGFDHYIKEELRIKYYVRYMDDFILLVETKEEAKDLKNKIEIYLNHYLKLKLNKKSNYFPNALGIDFCGYRIFETHLLLRKRFKKKLKSSIQKWEKLKGKEIDADRKFLFTFNSYKAHANHSNSYRFMQRMQKLIEEIEKTENV